MTTLFTKIIDGEIPGTFVYEDERVVAFLDVLPLTDGHVMVVPREEISHWIDMPEDLTDHVMAVAQKIGKAQKASFDCDRIGVMIQGYEVPHVHVHVWPTNSIKDFSNSARPAEMVPGEELEVHAAKIREALAAFG
ncbi:HIT family protein [Brevibacterium litoralis]|uniref:HIT family protein n=1 Tax=Brevibacterium litoralis TaxID=3138935 RepID=UPI0032EC058D